MIHFEKYLQEGNEFIDQLSRNLGHENDKGQVGIMLRSVLHVLRDSISIPQSLNLLSQLPMLLKAIYVEQWTYQENPKRIKTLEEFAKRVEEEQRKFGEHRFDWNESTVSCAMTVFSNLRKYVSQGEINGIIAELSSELKSLFEQSELKEIRK